MRIKITSDSTCDLPKELAQKLNVSIVPLTVIKNDEEFKKKYNEIADQLSRKKVDNSMSEDSRYVGFIDKKGRYVKYDRTYNDFLVYRKNDSITLHKKTYQNYLKVRNRDFKSEMPYNE